VAPGVVVVVGNGLSIAANPELALERLTSQFLERHGSDRADLDRLLSEVNLHNVDPGADFEGIVAGLESAEEVISAFMALASRSDHPHLQAAAELLRREGVPGLVRRLYFAYCAEILQAIDEGTRIQPTDPVLQFGQLIRTLYLDHHEMAIFTLNYDLLLERLLISEDLLDLRNSLTDLFSGLPERSEVVELAPGAAAILARTFYPEDPAPGRPIHLHHLHGCLTHFKRESDGTVVKVDATSLRASDVYGMLASTESSDYSPSVILGSKKVSKSRDWPFSFAFLELERRALEARTIVVAGYSFRDEAVNTRLQAAARRGERRWIVLNRKSGDDAEAFKAQVNALLSPATPDYFLDGFDGALPER